MGNLCKFSTPEVGNTNFEMIDNNNNDFIMKMILSKILHLNQKIQYHSDNNLNNRYNNEYKNNNK